MNNSKENKEKFFNRFTVVLTLVCIIIISVVGTVMLKAETKTHASIQKHENSKNIEESIDKINTGENSKTLYSPDVHGLININTANKETLILLDGIGETRAEAIINYRAQNQFKSTSEIMNVKGIGEKTYEKIKDKICIK